MIFDDLDQPAGDRPPGSSRRRRRRSHRAASSPRQGLADRAEQASGPRPPRRDPGATAWLVVLVLLVLGGAGFGWYVYGQQKALRPLDGEAPSSLLWPLLDPVLAPLETGMSGYGEESLARLEDGFRAASAGVHPVDREIYTVASNVGLVLREALADRARHIDRLVKLGEPVEGAVSGSAAPDANDRHLQLAVGVSWQRNSVAYRNRLEQLWHRLLRLEKGRFPPGAAGTSAPTEPASPAKPDASGAPEPGTQNP